ncbi:MAG TPA: response regulator [Anaerolineales bacterium]|nr:response regulator [Anaerolineales bacterium]
MNELAIIVEDDEDLATIFTEALQSAGYQVETLRDGLIAQKRVSQVEPHVVILDMHLPIVSGADLLKQIKADERLKKTIVVCATADARMGEAITDTADFVLIKPITFSQLRDLTARLHRL